MSEQRRGAVGGLDAAGFDAALERAAERVLATAADDTAGARVVARLLAEPRNVRGDLLWVPVAALALLVLVVSLPSRESASPADRSPAAGPVTAAAAVPAPGAHRSQAPDARGAAAPEGAPLAFVTAASGVAAPGARRRVRARAAAPSVEDDASTVPLLEVTGALRFAAADDGSGNALAPPPLPVDALALESLDPEALDPRRD